ncbi:serine/threonine protein kinase [Candidatus Bathycorpusculum sp.]|uniref:serine/threonine protein kinase n=1 Tax=Candidatus Bathycorpusculum sp. TaxID=2994959 RepID=UPI00281F08FC|nr:serine/threonine protein kinase [Candidatus Termitimicrobium sp.]MCL2431443.1 serine/threonine protein kinase [Candidatus Termitimicrobium sp.]
MPQSITVPVDQLVEEPYASVVCYPRATSDEMQTRVEELKRLGVETIEFSGKSSAFTLSVLGKGYVGIVTTAHVQGKQLALKMQRVDSERESLYHEAELLAMANTIGVGPQFVAVTKHFLLMQLIDGFLLEEWLTTYRDNTDVRTVLTDILEQCWRLDEIGLDHGELSKAPKHLLVNKSDIPFIVDFETASTQRNASNVTSVCQFLFQGNSEVCKTIVSIIGERDKTELLEALRNYRKNRNRQTFENLLKRCLTNNYSTK